MRELKCRALAADSVDDDMLNTWEVERDGRWVYGTYFSGYILNGQGEGDDDYFTVQGSWCPVKPETVGQDTGLLDKNGKEIFEGDLVRLFSKYHGDFVDGSAEVFFSYGYVGGWVIADKDNPEIVLSIGLHHDICEVIGNIHESDMEERTV